VLGEIRRATKVKLKKIKPPDVVSAASRLDTAAGTLADRVSRVRSGVYSVGVLCAQMEMRKAALDYARVKGFLKVFK